MASKRLSGTSRLSVTAELLEDPADTEALRADFLAVLEAARQDRFIAS